MKKESQLSEGLRELAGDVSETARYLILTTPRHGEFYRAITLPSRPGGLPPHESIDESHIAKAANEYGIEFVGPLPE